MSTPNRVTAAGPGSSQWQFFLRGQDESPLILMMSSYPRKLHKRPGKHTSNLSDPGKLDDGDVDARV